MSSRVGSAVALTAAVLLAVSSLPAGYAIGSRSVSSWWSGHPKIGDRESNLLDVHIGLVKSSGCFMNRQGEVRECTDEDLKFAQDNKQQPKCGCQAISLAVGFRITKYVAFGFVMLLMTLLLALGVTRSKRAGKLTLIVAAISAIATIVLLAMGPQFVGADVDSVPFGGGLMLFFAGTAASIVAALVSLRPARQPRTVPAAWVSPSTMMQGPAHNALPPPPQQAVFDVQALLQEDALRPTSLGPEASLGRSGHQMPVASPGGVLPGPSGPLAPMGPTTQPLFSSAPQLRPLYEAPVTVGGSNGLPPIKQPDLPTRGPTPISMSAVSAITGMATPPAPIPAAPAAGPKPLPPPVRNKPASVAPPIPPLPARVGSPTAQPFGKTLMSNAVPPPREVVVPNIPSIAPPVSKATLAGPPGMQLPVRPETDADDNQETVDFEKQTIDRAVFDTRAREPDPMDPALLATGDSTSPSFETATNESQNFDQKTDVGDDLETRARVKLESAESPTSTDTQAAPAPENRVSAAVMTSAPRLTPMPAHATPAPSASQQMSVSASGQHKVISTAPESLPPPKQEKPSAAAGPSPACPQCEAPMAWVEEHLRFYCKSCRMYF